MENDEPLRSPARAPAVRAADLFRCGSGTQPRLYYGDAKLEAPVYDYAKFIPEGRERSAALLASKRPKRSYAGVPTIALVGTSPGCAVGAIIAPYWFLVVSHCGR